VRGSAVSPSARTSGPAVYRPRRPERSVLHKTVREDLETYLAACRQEGDFTGGVPLHVETAFREYVKCGILAHGFARAFCAGCGHDFLIAFSCKHRDLWKRAAGGGVRRDSRKEGDLGHVRVGRAMPEASRRDEDVPRAYDARGGPDGEDGNRRLSFLSVYPSGL
ncbi:MAG: transposase zinc-binding domain-containing protein, partial [Acidobacteriota bacterium]